MAGVFIHTDNPFFKGDYIKVGETEGRVKEINLRATKLNTGNDEKIVLNNILTTNTVHNYSTGNRTSDSIEIKVNGDKAEQAEKIILKSCQEQEEVLEKPEPEVKYTSVDEGDRRYKTDQEQHNTGLRPQSSEKGSIRQRGVRREGKRC